MAMSVCSFTPQSPNTSLIYSNILCTQAQSCLPFSSPFRCDQCRKELYSQHLKPYREEKYFSLISQKERDMV